MVNSSIAIKMQNTFGRFIQLYHLNKLDQAVDLFAKDSHLWLPDRKINASGRESVKKALHAMQEERITKGYHRDCHIPHTPAYDTRDNDTLGLATWDIHSFEFADTKDGSDKVEYIYARVDARFILEDGRWKFLELDWWDVGSFVPWDYDKTQDDGLLTNPSDLPEPPEFLDCTTVHDFYAIQNVISRFGHNNRKYAMEDTFANRNDVSYRSTPFFPHIVTGRSSVEAALKKLDSMEEVNIGKYVYVPAISAPVIEVSPEGNTAKAQWMASCYTFEGEAFGIQEIPYRFIRRAGLLTADFVKEGNNWKVIHMDTTTYFTAPAIAYDSFCQLEHTGDGKFYQRMGMKENRWKPALPKMGGDFPEEMAFLESLPAVWVNAYRRGDYLDFFEKWSFNEEHETVFHSRGQGRCAPAFIGTDKIHEFFSRGAFTYHHQQITNHGGMSPDIEVSMDGRYCTISLFDMNSTAYDPGNGNHLSIDLDPGWNMDNSGFEHTPSRFQFSVYQFHFAKVNGEWKIIVCDWEQLGDMEDQKLAGKASRGWSGSITDLKYPQLFEKYHYSERRKLPEGYKW